MQYLKIYSLVKNYGFSFGEEYKELVDFEKKKNGILAFFKKFFVKVKKNPAIQARMKFFKILRHIVLKYFGRNGFFIIRI